MVNILENATQQETLRVRSKEMEYLFFKSREIKLWIFWYL